MFFKNISCYLVSVRFLVWLLDPQTPSWKHAMTQFDNWIDRSLTWKLEKVVRSLRSFKCEQILWNSMTFVQKQSELTGVCYMFYNRLLYNAKNTKTTWISHWYLPTGHSFAYTEARTLKAFNSCWNIKKKKM